MLERPMPCSAALDMTEERPERGDEPTSTVPLHNQQDGPETKENSDTKRVRSPESGSEFFSDKEGHFRYSLSPSEEPTCVVATTRDIRGQMAHHAAGGSGTQRSDSRNRGRRSKERDRGVGGSGGGRANGKHLLPPSPLKFQQSWPVVPFSPPSSLTDALSIYSGTGGLSKTSSFGVISGPFTNRQGPFRDRHVRIPRTADGSASPTRSAVLIYVTTRSNFDVPSPQPQGFPRPVSSRGGDSRKWRTKHSATRPHHRGGMNDLGGNSGGWGVDDAGTNVSFEMRSGQHPKSPPLQQRPKTAPLGSMHAPWHGAGEGPPTWFRDARVTESQSARRQHLHALRGGNSAAGNSFSNGYHQNKTFPVRARTAAARRIGHAAPRPCGPGDLILSPERAAARLASIRNAYGLQNAIRLRGSSLQATALRSSPNVSLSAYRRGKR